ncbi:MAG: hypothetical protein E7632_08890 [Ruminococcaceae bacterium]|nr:hypothetical protein [Oscillospiraceae bacterium]
MDMTNIPRRCRELDISGIRLYSAENRRNLVTVENLMTPSLDVPDFAAEGFDELCERILAAKNNGRPIIVSIGAHVIKCGLSRYLIALAKAGFITHFAGNGASSIHDFELAYLGGTSEDVPTAIEDGSFGMWEETLLMMNEAINDGAARGMGYGEALGEYIGAHPDRFPHREDCVLWNLCSLDIPATYHIALGTDIIHQSPTCDMASIGACSGRDFKRFCYSVSQLDGGVYLNFGSAVIGPEVFLKALSMARNLGYPTFKITTANFDLKPLGDYRCKIGYEDPNYYYRPRKNIVNRPVSQGGKGWHFEGDHQVTIPALYKRLMEAENV